MDLTQDPGDSDSKAGSPSGGSFPNVVYLVRLQGSSRRTTIPSISLARPMGRKNLSFAFTDSVLLLDRPGSIGGGPLSGSVVADSIFNDPDAWNIGSASDYGMSAQLKPFTHSSQVHWETFHPDDNRKSIQAYPFLTLGEPTTKDDLYLDFKRLSVLFTPGSTALRSGGSVLSPVSFPSPVTPAPSLSRSRSGAKTTFTPLSIKTAFSPRPASVNSPQAISASATWSMLQFYGSMPDTPHGLRTPHTPRTPMSAAFLKKKKGDTLDIPPVPSLPLPSGPPSLSNDHFSIPTSVIPPTPPPRYETATEDKKDIKESPPKSTRPLPTIPRHASTRSLPAIPIEHLTAASPSKRMGPRTRPVRSNTLQAQ